MNHPKIILIAILGVILLALQGSTPSLAAQRQQTPHEEQQKSGGDSDRMQNMPGMDQDMPGMKMDQGAEDRDPQAEHAAMNAMSHMHHHQTGPHMYMTKLRPSNPQDWAKADGIAKELRDSIEKYKDYHTARADGFRIFMPNVPQDEYHFTNYYYAYLETFSFDPTRPTSLLYKKTKNGYDLIGAMYTMPKRVSEDQLNERIPLSVAQWHLHTNLCMPPKGERGHADMTRFGLTGSITTKGACTEAGGTFYPVIFGWMVHVYPFENTREKIWAQ
jgi:hypothetical protein